MKAKIGLEIHGYLVTKEKLFCKCKTNYKETQPNSNICPICTGQPGSKPMSPNIEAIKKIIQIALMLNCKISSRVIWQRKHYYWPDLPKGYQDTISGAYSFPIGYEGNFLGIRIRDVHLEEDPARWDPESGRIDYNRSGLPLVEIVTEPDFSSSKEVEKWLKQFVLASSYIKALDKDAGIKADINISVAGRERVEIKNLNSIANIVEAIEYETKRQAAEIKKGIAIKRETRAFDEKRKITVAMREKELTEDYRFIPDPDLSLIFIKKEIVEEIEKKLPEFPQLKIERFVAEGVRKREAEILAKEKELADFFEKVRKEVSAEIAAEWICNQLLRILNWNKKKLEEVDIKVEHFVELLRLVQEKRITEGTAKKMLNEFVPKSFSPLERIKELEMICDREKIKEICKEIIEKEKKAVEDYKKGEEKAFNFLIGKIMQKTKKRANIKIVKEILFGLLKSN